MATRKDIAKKAAKIAAVKMYNAIMKAPFHKVAGVGKASKKELKIQFNNVIKQAVLSTYKEVTKKAQTSSSRVGTGAFFRDFPACAEVLQKISLREPIPNDVIQQCKTEWNTPGAQEKMKAEYPAEYNGMFELMNPNAVRKA